MKEMNLEIDGTVFKFLAGNTTPVTVTWPSTRVASQIRLSTTPGTNTIVFDGPWALFRMFERFDVQPTAQPERFVVPMLLEGRKAWLEVTASSVFNPFRLKEIQQFRCPGSLRQGRRHARPPSIPERLERRRADPRLVRQAAVARRFRVASPRGRFHRAVDPGSAKGCRRSAHLRRRLARRLFDTPAWRFLLSPGRSAGSTGLAFAGVLVLGRPGRPPFISLTLVASCPGFPSSPRSSTPCLPGCIASRTRRTTRSRATGASTIWRTPSPTWRRRAQTAAAPSRTA